MTVDDRSSWHSSVRCPRCRARVSWRGSSVACQTCHVVFPIARGVPLLLDARDSVFDPVTIARATGTATQRRGLRRLIPEISLNPGADARYRSLRDHLAERRGVQKVLVIGAGEGGRGIQALEAGDVELLRSDVAIGPTTDLCLDAHAIPFADGSFDAVIAQAVLEHVVSPQDCLSEFARVLKPGGLVYAETPFMQQVHMGAYDFTRFTPLGHRRLFRMFEEIESGVAVGPGSALAWSLVYFVISFAHSARSERVLGVLARCAFFWLKYFDLHLNQRAAAGDAAAGVYFIGRLKSDAVEDRDIIAAYDGGRRFR